MVRLAPCIVLGGLLAAGPGCSLVTVQQDPFPALEIRADRPAPPPARVVLTDSNIQILDKVQFETGSDKLLPVSFPLLDQVAQVMLENEQIELIEIQGHTDSTGSAGINRKLSAARAESVKRYLADKKIAKARMTAKGYGPDVPIADNATVNSPIVVSGRTGNAPATTPVLVNIVHTYKGDLKVDLVAPDGSVYVLHNRTGGSADNINQTYNVNLSGEALNGTWRLRARDRGAADVGYINSWSITF